MTLPLCSFPLPPLGLVNSSEVSFDRPRSSSPSSIVVALVEYDPFADELRLCGGEGTLDWPSEARLLLTRGTAADDPALSSKDTPSDMRYKVEPSLFREDFFSFETLAVLMRLASDALFRGEVGDVTEAEVPGRDIVLGGWGN